jgi:transposase
MNVKYIVELSDSEREILLNLVSKGKNSARKLKRGHILLMAEKNIQMLILQKHCRLAPLLYLEQNVLLLKANIFIFFDRYRGWRKVKVTEQKTAIDFADFMRDLVDVHYPHAEKIRLVMDNLGTHKPASRYKAFSPEAARRILRKIEFHYTPKHASWLNMVEIEIGNMNQQCLDRRFQDKEALIKELMSWELSRNKEKASIRWMFDLTQARTKLTRAYDVINRS